MEGNSGRNVFNCLIGSPFPFITGKRGAADILPTNCAMKKVR